VLWHLLGLICLWGAVYLPYAGAPEWHYEEARRAVPAREMIASGDWVQPTLFGHTYLNKPPLYMWAVAAASQIVGAVNPWSTRWPSLLGTLLGAWVVLAFARRALHPRAGLWAGAFYLLTWQTFDTGRLGEIEGLFGPLVLASVCALWWAPVSWGAALLAASALGAALLAKGPPALLYLVAAYLGLAWVRGRSIWKRPSTWAPLVLGLVPVAIWAALLLQEVPMDQVLGRWGGELQRAGDGGLQAYASDRLRFVAGVVLGFFPASWLVIGALASRRKEPLGEAHRYLLASLGLALLLFALPVGTRPRYAFPALGLAALCAGQVVAELRDRNQRFRSLAAWRPVAVMCGVLGLGLLVAVLLTPQVDLLQAGLPRGIAWVPLAVAAASGAVALRMGLSPLRRDFLPLALLTLAAGRIFQSVHLTPAQALLRPHQELAQALQERRQAGDTVWTRAGGQFNAQAYLDPAPKWLPEDKDPARPGDWLILLPEQADGWPKGTQWEEILQPEADMNRWRILRRIR